MTLTQSLKTAGFTFVAIAMTAGMAHAGNGKDCYKKDHSGMNKDAKAENTMVLDAKAEAKDAKTYKATKEMKTLTFDEAVTLCTKKQVADLQACVDKKTGQAKPES